MGGNILYMEGHVEIIMRLEYLNKPRNELTPMKAEPSWQR